MAHWICLVAVRGNVIANVMSKDLIAMNVMLIFMISLIVMNALVAMMDRLMVHAMITVYAIVNMALVVTNAMNAQMDYMVFHIAKVNNKNLKK